MSDQPDIADELMEEVERIMTRHWDLAACQCLTCRLGRLIGFRPRARYDVGSPEYQAPKPVAEEETT